MNIVFIGHVDAGKSTIGGQILYLTVSCMALAWWTMYTVEAALGRLCMWLRLVVNVVC